jgi:hypothetical protein
VWKQVPFCHAQHSAPRAHPEKRRMDHEYKENLFDAAKILYELPLPLTGNP